MRVFKTGITGWHDSHFNLAAIEQVPQLSPARFLQFNLNERMPAFIARKKICQTDSQSPGVWRRREANQPALPSRLVPAH